MRSATLSLIPPPAVLLAGLALSSAVAAPPTAGGAPAPASAGVVNQAASAARLAAADPKDAVAAPPAPSLAPPAGSAADDSAAHRDPFLAPPPGAALPDSAAPMQEAVRLSTHGAFSKPSARVGDSLDYVVAVEWEDTQVPVVVLAPDSADFPGFRILGQATQHKKLANGQAVKNRTEFVYSLRATAQGPGKAASLKVRYLTGLSQREEAVFIPSALIDIGPAPVRLLDMLWFQALLWLAALGAAAAAGWAAFRLASRKRAEARPQRADLRPEAEALKARLRTAQNNPESSRAILSEMESLAVRYLKEETGGAGTARFETLLEAYLSKDRASEAADWAKLKELFRHARFAGGYKEPHELQDAFRTFRKCLKIQAEDEL
jgi:hypothetical protein